MLEDCLLESRPSARARKPFSVVFSVITHGVIAGALILIPLLQNQLLPNIPDPAPLRPPEVSRHVVELARVPSGSPSSAPAPASTAVIAPVAIPIEIARVVDSAPPSVGFLLRADGPGGNGLPGLPPGFGGEGLLPPAAPPPPPPVAPPRAPDPPPAPTKPERRGGDVMQSALVYQVTPQYPVLALKSGSQGIVLLEAVITREGVIDPGSIRVLKGHVLLNEAAISAVRQWRYRPTLLNGQPIEVLTTITLNFTLNRN